MLSQRIEKDKNHPCGGVSILMVTPLDQYGRLCASDFESLLEFVGSPSVNGQTIAGVTVCGEMGEGFCLSNEDQDHIIQRAKARLGREKTVIAAIFALSLRDAIEQAQRHAKSGADALLIAPVATFPYSGKALRKFFQCIGEAVGLPVIAYLNKMYKHELPDAETIQGIFELPTVAGIKDSTGDLAFIARLIAQRPVGKVVIHTVSSNALAGIRAGVDGLMVGTSNLVPEAAIAAWVYGRMDDMASQEQAKRAQERLSQAAQLYKIAPDASSKDWVIVKEALRHMGVIREEARYPALPYELLAVSDREKLQVHLAALLSVN